MAIQFDNSNTGVVTLKPASSGSYSLTLPSADGTNGQVLQTDGSGVLSFATASSTPSVYLNEDTVSSNITIPSGQNGFSVGPMTVSSGVSVTVTSGQRWVVI